MGKPQCVSQRGGLKLLPKFQYCAEDGIFIDYIKDSGEFLSEINDKRACTSVYYLPTYHYIIIYMCINKLDLEIRYLIHDLLLNLAQYNFISY